jgi:YD repeat-containing protein
MSSTTDADNKTTGFEFDALSRTTGVIDALNQHYQFAYDAVSRLSGITRGGVSMSYQYGFASKAGLWVDLWGKWHFCPKKQFDSSHP